MPLPHTLTTPAGRAAYVADRHYDELVRRAAGSQPSAPARSTAEDAVQEVLHGLAQPGSWAPEQPDELLAYAAHAVRVTNAQLVREHAEARVVPLTGEELGGTAFDPADVHAVHTEALAQVRGALDRLPHPQARAAAVLHLLAVERGTIATAVGTTPRSVRTWIERFRLALRDEGRSLS